MKRHTNATKISTTEYVSQLYNPVHLSAEADICGNCPFPKCIEEEKKTKLCCEYLKTELKKRKRSELWKKK